LIIKSICAGLHSNFAYYNGKLKDGTKVYRLMNLNQETCIHPSSVVSILSSEDSDSRFILFGELMRSERLYIKNISPVKLEWISSYTKFDLSQVEQSAKETLSLEIYPGFIATLNSRNSEMIESLEERIGCIVFLEDN
jgi:hypothetical protein